MNDASQDNELRTQPKRGAKKSAEIAIKEVAKKDRQLSVERHEWIKKARREVKKKATEKKKEARRNAPKPRASKRAPETQKEARPMMAKLHGPFDQRVLLRVPEQAAQPNSVGEQATSGNPPRNHLATTAEILGLKDRPQNADGLEVAREFYPKVINFLRLEGERVTGNTPFTLHKEDCLKILSELADPMKMKKTEETRNEHGFDESLLNDWIHGSGLGYKKVAGESEEETDEEYMRVQRQLARTLYKEAIPDKWGAEMEQYHAFVTLLLSTKEDFCKLPVGDGIHPRKRTIRRSKDVIRNWVVDTDPLTKLVIAELNEVSNLGKNVMGPEDARIDTFWCGLRFAETAKYVQDLYSLQSRNAEPTARAFMKALALMKIVHLEETSNHQ